MTRLRRGLAVLGLLAGMNAAPALAEVPITYLEGNKPVFTIDVPDFWYMRSGGDRVLNDPKHGEDRPVSRVIGLEPVDRDGVWMGFVVPDGVTTLEEAYEYLQYVGPSLLSDAEIAEAYSRRIGGQKAVVANGTGRRGGRTINFTATVIDLPGPHVAVAVAIVEPGADPGRVAQLNAVFDSFRVVR
ncbi:hypothetical protein [Shimia biformata]|uniref:hypothetical protein n=1 Tax=Shimia biformata TaxID=1294299 RepID=UPI0019515C5E|nr:hypothetical protein [Shimia biformata]